MQCFLGHEDIDPDDPMVWRATSCWSRSGRMRAGVRGGTDRIEKDRHPIFCCDLHLQQWRRGVLNQQSLVIDGTCAEVEQTVPTRTSEHFQGR